MLDLGQGAVTSQAGFLNLNIMNIMWINLPSLMWFMLYKGLHDSLMCPACDITARAREGRQCPGPRNEPTTEMYVAPKRFGIQTSNLGYVLVIP